MKKLFKTDFVIYDKKTDHVLDFGNGDIVIFGSKEDADADCKGNEEVISCNDLPQHWKEVILKQINKD